MTIPKKNCYNTRYLLIALFLLITLFFALPFAAVPGRTAHAEEKVYTGVLEDLRKDPNFNEEDYTANSGSYGIRFIQLAESVDGELFVYVYLPCRTYANISIVPTDIRFSCYIGENASWRNYTLTELSFEHNIGKYKVDGFTVLADPLRYYNISSLLRNYISGVDNAASAEGLIISKVALSVPQLWTVCTVENQVYYRKEVTDVVQIINPYAGTVRYDSRNNLYPNKDSHFIAFSTDKQIDTLLEADVSYNKQTERRNGAFEGLKTELSSVEHCVTTVNYDSVETVNTGVFVKKSYTWHSIQTPDDFIASSDALSESEKNSIRSNQWVIRFLTTDYVDSTNFLQLLTGQYVSTKVSDVSVLRLKFITEGNVYNLGAVSNVVSGTDVWQGNESSSDIAKNWFENLINNIKSWFQKYGKWILIGIAAIVLLIVIAPFLPTILSALIHLIILIGKGLFWIISAPVRLIASLFKRKGDDK